MPDGLLDDGAGGSRKRQQLPEEVATYVRGLIFSGEVKPGDFLRIEPIAEAVSVSNTPVREGLLTLRSEGFVRLVPRRGFVVAPFTPQDVHDLFWAQAKLAGELAARAAAKITPTQLERLVTVHNLHTQAVADGDVARVSELGHAFHAEINKAADSYRLALLLNSIVKQLPSTFAVTIEGQIAASASKHRQLVTTMRRHDSDKARSRMEQHTLEGAEHLINTLNEQGIFGDGEKAAAS
jgi:DNA-binding GntR family transcriptional regulator